MVDGLTEALDELLAIDGDGLTDGALHVAVVGLQRERARLDAVLARFVAVWEGRRVWEGDGSKAAWARLSRDCRLSARAAHADVRLARAFRVMPVTAQALADGRLSVDHVDALIAANRPEVGDVFARDEPMLVEQAGELSFPDFQRVLAYWRQRADAAGAEARAADADAARHLAAAHTFEGSVDIRGLLDPVNGGILLEELGRLEQQLFEADWAAARAEHGGAARPEHLARTPAQRRADALVEMARRSAARSTSAVAARPLISVLVGYETFAGRVCELADGTVITPGQILPLLTDADIERVVFDGPSRVIDVGVRQRLFTGGLRRAIEVRDRHCTHAGCRVPASRCHVDHIVEYARGGPTNQENGRLLCPVHNRRRPTHAPGP